MDANYIRDTAIKLNDDSLRYHLAHACLACETYVQDEFQRKLKEKKSEITKQKANARRRRDNKEFEKLCQDEGRLERRNTIRIYIEYTKVKPLDEDSGRVVYLNNNFIVYIPHSLLDKSVSGKYNYSEYAKRIREIMAHELGHIVLHHKELMMTPGLQGSGSELFKGEKEKEAQMFGDELLSLRVERNTNILENGSFNNVFASV